MAITANIKRGAETYNSLHAGSIDSAVVANSDQTYQPNFRYIYKLRLGHYYDPTTEIITYLQPNPYGYGVFNPKTIYQEHKYASMVPKPLDATPFLFYIAGQHFTDALLMSYDVRVQVLEGWDVGGVFTEDANEIGPAQIDIHVKHGNRGNLKPAIARVDANSIAYTDVTAATFKDKVRHLLPANLATGYTYLVAQSGDQGPLIFDGDDGTYNTVNTSLSTVARYTFYDEDGVELGVIDTDPLGLTAGGLAFVHAYPGNVSNFIGWYTGTAFYSIELIEDEATAVSTKYLVVMEANNCRYDNIRVAWIGENGGLEYFNFPLKNERTYDIDRKQYIKPFGNYGTVGAGISDTDAGLFGPDLRDVRNVVNREANVTTSIAVTSDWLSEAEFNYLKSLLVAEHVYILTNINGEFKTAVIEDRNYLERRERNTKKYNLQLRLRYGQVYEAIDYNLLPPPPVPCTYYTVFTKIGGNSGLTVTEVAGDMVIVSTAATRSQKINVSVVDTLGGTPNPGTNYYVRVQLSSAMPASNADGQVRLGDAGAAITYFDGATLDFLASGIWGTHLTTGSNYVYVKLPNFLSGATWTGTITITIGTNSCP